MQLTEEQNRREAWTYGGWNLRDDDTPSPPEADPGPLSSAQARRAARLISTASNHRP